MDMDNKKLREKAIRDGYRKLEEMDPGSKEYAILAETIGRLEQSEREDYKADENAILEDRRIMIEEERAKKTLWERCLEVAKIIVPTGAYIFVTTCLIPKAEKDDYVPPQAKNLDPRRLKFWDK